MAIPRNLSNLAPGADTSGVLGVAKGGTGAASLTGVIKGSGTSAFTAGNVNLASEVTGTLPTANGGTGLTSVGTNGQVLQSNGTTLSWQTPSTGAMTLISTQTVSSASLVEWTGLTGSQYLIRFFNLTSSAGAGSFFYILFGRSSYVTSGYSSLVKYSNQSSNTWANNYNSGGSSGFLFYIGGSSDKSTGQVNILSNASITEYFLNGGAGYLAGTACLTGGVNESIGGTLQRIQIVASNGAATFSGTFSLYQISE